MSRDRQAGQSSSIKISNKLFEGVEQFRYLEITLTNKNFIREEITSRLKSGNACCHPVQNLLPPSSIPTGTKITRYRSGNFACFLYLWGDEHRLRMFASKVLRKVFGPKRDEVTGEGDWRKLHNKELYDLYSSPNIIRLVTSRRTRLFRYVARMGTEDMRKGVWRGNLREGSPGRPRRRWEGNGKIDLGFINLEIYICISNLAHLMRKTKEVARTFSVVIRLCH